MSALTIADQKFLSLAPSSLWRLIPGLAGFICRSNTVVLTAFCSSPVRRARLSVKVSAMRKFIIFQPYINENHNRYESYSTFATNSATSSEDTTLSSSSKIFWLNIFLASTALFKSLDEIQSLFHIGSLAPQTKRQRGSSKLISGSIL